MKRNSAYTLIELLIVIAIIGILATIGFVSFREFSRRQTLTGVLKAVKADLRSAQQFALTGQKPEGCVTLSGYLFNLSDSYVYELIASCEPSDIIIKTVDLSSKNITISSLPSFIKFKVLGQGTDLISSLTLTLTHDLAGTTGQVTIGIGGDIE